MNEMMLCLHGSDGFFHAAYRFFLADDFDDVKHVWTFGSSKRR